MSKHKNITHPTRIPLMPNEVPEGLWQTVTMDFITDLPQVRPYDSIHVTVDKSTKGVIYTPCAKTIDTEGMADLYMENIWKQYGLPRKIISDRGPQFAMRFTKELWKKLGITTMLSTVYHPETDRETERVNQELKQYLHAFCNYEQTNWPELLPYAEFAHNIQEHLAMHQSPFQLLYGFNPSFAP